ncbi:DUF45 domain-containing protein [Caloramator sp. mosi_1]|uniref:YgjP-like metallopeptidase domain-containing protein n=1 Tax=Caloramator sp. mosi_1 TaxID=3023090 RepID=UPI00235E959E|nr:YgjP-like metallopeptidase domain-containing protein [Caloramator sp. mosi_1]WDC85323.1 DUF45 domain-containing protein [Caloramator sp. mosi_1]
MDFKKLKEVEKIKDEIAKIDYKNGGEIEYIGNKLILHISEDNVDKIHINLEENRLIVKLPRHKGELITKENLKTEISSFLKGQAKVILKERVEVLSKNIILSPTELL